MLDQNTPASTKLRAADSVVSELAAIPLHGASLVDVDDAKLIRAQLTGYERQSGCGRPENSFKKSFFAPI
jgi:hypothetical protein